MAITTKRSSSDDDFLNVGPDATATFDNFPDSSTEYASSENLDADEDELEDEDLDEEEEEYDDEADDDEEEEYDDDADEDDDEDGDDEDEGDEEDHDLARGPRAPSVYRKG